MTLKYRLSAILAISLAFSACKKDDDSTNSTPQQTDYAGAYMPIYPGNYWIYESWVVDEDGVGAPGMPNGQPPVYDSVYAISDTTINGNNYRRYSAPIAAGSKDNDTYAIRDSLGYLVDVNGLVQYALTDSVSVFASRTFTQPQFSDDSVVTIQYKRDGNRQFIAPAGTFNTSDMVYDWSFIPFVSKGRPVSSRHQYTRYARHVGIVSQTMPFYISDPKYVERRLIRKHVTYPIE